MTKFHKAVWGGPDYSEGPETVAPVVARLSQVGQRRRSRGDVIFGDDALTDEDLAGLAAL